MIRSFFIALLEKSQGQVVHNIFHSGKKSGNSQISLLQEIGISRVFEVFKLSFFASNSHFGRADLVQIFHLRFLHVFARSLNPAADSFPIQPLSDLLPDERDKIAGI